MPAPLAQPATRTVFPPMRQLAAARFGRVSVVMMARFSPSKACAENSSDSARPGAAFRMRSTFKGTPITPVEQTTTCCARQPSSFPTHSAVAREATMPSGPTEQLAFPELTMTARIGVRRLPHMLARENHGRRLHEILREHGGCRRRGIGNDQRDIQRAGVAALLQAAGRRCKTKPARQGAG